MPWWFWIFVLVIGACLGSFINCLIWRLRQRKTILGRSMCPDCRHQIDWYDNIPLLSFILLKGRCRHCRKKISWQYPVVEVATALLFTAVFYRHWSDFFSLQSFVWLLIRDWFFILVLEIIFIYDLRWYLIPDSVTLPAAFVIFFLNIYLGYSLSSLIWSGLLGAGFFLVQFLISRGTWIGGGDIRIGLLLGLAFADWQVLLLTIFLAYITGSVVGLTLIFKGKKKWGSKLPLGVFLSMAAVISVFWGDKILFWYQNMILK